MPEAVAIKETAKSCLLAAVAHSEQPIATVAG
jgi:hypothetical protein